MAQYGDEFIDRLHLIWGPGFLSPGGPEEVAGIVRGIDLTGSRVLDIGCGTGGPAIVLARDMGAQVVSIDIEPQLLDRARRLAAEAGVAERIEFKLVEPGPLPFGPEDFDAVFSKDALIHISDKQALYTDILRVLKPGGRFAASDWLKGQNADSDPAFQKFLAAVKLNFAMATASETAEAMRKAGFEDVETTDRNAWYAALAAEEVEAIEGPLREDIIRVSSREIYESWLGVRRRLAQAAHSGGLRPTHVRGRRPA